VIADVPGQICNTYFAEYCGKGSCRFFNVDNGSAVAWQCEIRFQPDFNSEEDTPVAYDHYIDYDDYSLPFGYNESFGSGKHTQDLTLCCPRTAVYCIVYVDRQPPNSRLCLPSRI
jgi:hypothetical protein